MWLLYLDIYKSRYLVSNLDYVHMWMMNYLELGLAIWGSKKGRHLTPGQPQELIRPSENPSFYRPTKKDTDMIYQPWIHTGHIKCRSQLIGSWKRLTTSWPRGDSNIDRSQLPGSTCLSGRFNPAAALNPRPNKPEHTSAPYCKKNKSVKPVVIHVNWCFFEWFRVIKFWQFCF